MKTIKSNQVKYHSGKNTLQEVVHLKEYLTLTLSKEPKTLSNMALKCNNNLTFTDINRKSFKSIKEW